MDKHNEKYFEGTLQLRNPSEELLNFVANAIRKAKVNLAKTVEYDNGIDLYLGCNKFLRSLGKKLESSFSGQLKETATLHTRRNNKDLYRVTVLFKQANFYRGDIFVIKGDECEIMKVGDKVQVKLVKTGKNKMFPFEVVELAKSQ